MLADRSDLEPMLDDLKADERAPDASPSRSSGRAVLAAALVLALAAVPLALVLQQRVDDARAELAAAQQVQAEAARAREEADARLRAGAFAEAERAGVAQRAADAERFDATASRFVMRDPITTLPADVRLCRAEDIEVFHPGGEVHGLGISNRSGRPCGLLDHPGLQGRDASGRWRPILFHPSAASSYTDGPGWEGLLLPGKLAMIGIDHREPLRSGECLSGAAPVEQFSGLRLVLAPQAPPLEVPDATFSTGPCRPEVLLWAYDHEGG